MNKLNYFQNKPKATQIDIHAYLTRLGLEKEEPSLQYLKKLQKQHLISIPFENLDIHYGRKIVLDYTRIFDKIVNNQRGGFCHELNGLFYHLLYHLGFDCYIISARVWDEKNRTFGRPFEHMAIIVRLDDYLWLVDVGFGDGLVHPFKVKQGEARVDNLRYWRIETDPDELFILQVSEDASHYQNKLIFDSQEKQLIEFIDICNHQQTSPDSTFTQKKLITKLTQNGRVTLTDHELVVKALGETVRTAVLHEDDFFAKLEQHFSITSQQLNPFEN